MFKATLYIGVEMSLPLQKLWDQSSPALKSLLELTPLSIEEKIYLTKKLETPCMSSTLPQLEAHFCSLLKRLSPDFLFAPPQIVTRLENGE